jgi:hypothetical protein
MKGIFRNFMKKSNSGERKNPPSLYRIPEMTWMTDVKKASECGAALIKKSNSKKLPGF